MSTDTHTTPAPTTAGVARLGAIVLDCADPLSLAAFYARLTGWAVAASSESSWAEIAMPFGGMAIAFQQVEDYVAPAWPGTNPPQQFHLDLDVDDLDAGEAAALAIGATKHDHQPGESFRVFLDPEGHPFCLCRG